MTAAPQVLSVHAVDTSGSEGLVADARACDELGCRASAVTTAVIAVGDQGAEAVEGISAEAVGRQLEIVLRHRRPGAVRTGIFVSRAQVEVVARGLAESRAANVVVAPVLRMGSGRLADPAALDEMRRLFYPMARVVVIRAADLAEHGLEPTDEVEGAMCAARAIRERGSPAAVVCGVVRRSRIVDVLDDAGQIAVFDATRVAGGRRGGIVAAHPAAIAALLARGETLDRAVEGAQRFVGSHLTRES